MMKKTNIIFVGGETAGPIMPLLALAQAWIEKDPSINPIFLDIPDSVAAHIIPKASFTFQTMTAGKLRRYWSWNNLLSPLLILIGLVRSLFLFAKLRPKLVVGAGGYVQVPVILAAWIMRIPRAIHQQDIIPSFSNRSVSLLANRITVTFEKSLKDFSQGSGFEKDFGEDTKIYWTGNPSHLDDRFVLSEQAKAEAQKLFCLDKKWPTILILGGGSGAAGLNDVVRENLPDLLKTAQVIHSAGVGKMVHPSTTLSERQERYHQYEFIDRMDLAYAVADIVISRAGVGTLTELSKLGIPSLVIPMPNSHQEWNAKYLYDTDAAIIVDQSDLSAEMLGKMVRKIFFDAKLQKELSDNIMKIMPRNATEQMLQVLIPLLRKNDRGQ